MRRPRSSLCQTILRKDNMKTTSKMLSLCLVLAAALAGTTGCSKTPKPDAKVVQGTWKGQEPNATASSSLVMTGTNLEFHGANPQEWYKGSYTLRDDTNPKQMIVVITECADPITWEDVLRDLSNPGWHDDHLRPRAGRYERARLLRRANGAEDCVQTVANRR